MFETGGKIMYLNAHVTVLDCDLHWQIKETACTFGFFVI